MPKMEHHYKTLLLTEVVAEMEAFTKDGWELVAACKADSVDHIHTFWKRRKEDPAALRKAALAIVELFDSFPTPALYDARGLVQALKAALNDA